MTAEQGESEPAGLSGKFHCDEPCALPCSSRACFAMRYRWVACPAMIDAWVVSAPCTELKCAPNLGASSCSCQRAAEHQTIMMHCKAAMPAVLCTQAWDQSVYNQEIFFLAHGPYTAPNVTVRVMDIYKFMNSKASAVFAVLVQVTASRVWLEYPVALPGCLAGWVHLVLNPACCGCRGAETALASMPDAKCQAGAPLTRV